MPLARARGIVFSGGPPALGKIDRQNVPIDLAGRKILPSTVRAFRRRVVAPA